MGYDLRNKNEAFRAAWWGDLLTLAQYYGWQPEGTQAPEYFSDPAYAITTAWDGSYSWNDGQRVTESDAAALAVALESALPFVAEQKNYTDEMPRSAISITDIFSGERGYLQEVIDFCRAGEFIIR